MGGMKRKIPMAKIEKKDSRAVAFSKRRNGLFGKASELCLLSGANIAILATPVSSNSNVSFYSFGHSSVDSVVSAFLANHRPREDLGLGFWWEDESLHQSDDPDELRLALDSMSTLINKVKGLNAVKTHEDLEDLKNNDVGLLGTHQKLDQNQTLTFDSTSASLSIQDDLPADFDGVVKRSEEEQILPISDNNNLDDDIDNLDLSHLDVDEILALLDNNDDALPGDLGWCNLKLDFETKSMNLEMADVSMVTTNQNPCSGHGSAEDGALVMRRDLDGDNFHFSDLVEDQNLAVSNKNNGSSTYLDWCNQTFDLDEIFDFETKSEGLPMNWKMDDAWMMTTSQNPCSDSETVEDRALLIQRDFDEDNLRFSEVCNELASITAL